jgi:hypothetical protein
MADERQDSIRQGIAAPPESEIGRAAADENRHRNAQAPPIGGGMGGTSDSETPADEAQMKAALDGIPGSPGRRRTEPEA